MTTEELKEEIEKIIADTFNELKEIYLCCKDIEHNSIDSKSGVIFPRYSKENIRVSEQELRCMFIQNLCKRGLCYSVETPTKKKYIFKEKNAPEVFEAKEEKGESARIDLTIHDKNDLNKRLCIIEFKAHGGTSGPNYKKDLLKLYAEPEGDLRYFVQIFEGFNSGTKKSVEDKITKSLEYILKKYPEYKDVDVQYRFYAFNPTKNSNVLDIIEALKNYEAMNKRL